MSDKIIPFDKTENFFSQLKKNGKQVVFTNGCFDILHIGHLRYLTQARGLGDVLVVGLNSDSSVRSLNKGPDRPINSEVLRAEMLLGLKPVDFVSIFSQSTPYELIKNIKPAVLVKGGDWSVGKICGSDVVQSYGGKVLSLPFVEGFSTTKIIQNLKSRPGLN